MPTMTAAGPHAPTQPRVHRIEVRPRPGVDDPRGRAVMAQAAALGLPARSVSTARVYLISAPLDEAQVRAVCERLLADPVTEAAAVGASPARGAEVIEVHPLPGVMDPAGLSVREALEDLVGVSAVVSTGVRYDLEGLGREQGEMLARRALANPVIHAIHFGPFTPERLPRGREYRFALRHIPLRDLGEEDLARLSREAHLFLSPEEMRAIQAEYRRIGREPTDIELETLAQTWSEHCVHKTLKSRIRYRQEGKEAPGHEGGIEWEGRPGHSVRRTQAGVEVEIDNLLKSTVAAATHELIAEGVDWTLSVFKDNAGVVAFDERHAVCIKVETHNHPSAIEPYGGAATGAGGCIRDVIGTGLAARPIASTDVFCVAFPGRWEQGEQTSRPGDGERMSARLPPGTLHPRRVLTDVVAGVRDYGNRMGIPTVSGAVYFDDRYIGNPLVFCGCVGIMPRDRVRGEARPGDRIIALGGRTGRDGIHGATFSSAELEGTSADEFSHAVQIGNAIEEKRVMDAILRARDEGPQGPLFSAITDCGAGGFSSAIGEMGAALGADVHLDRAPLKYAGLSYTEIWISEAQERMVLAVPPGHLAALKGICDEEHVEVADLGHFGTPGAEIVLSFHGQEVGRLSTRFLHDGIPQPVREAAWDSAGARRREGAKRPSAALSSLRAASARSCLHGLLAHPNIASKHWIIRQYDHEVQGNTVLKPLTGPALRGPGDGAILEPVPGTGQGLAVSQGLQTGLGDPARGGDPYLMALAAIDECVRNLVCLGADPARIAILDNFCWPSCSRPANLGALVRAAEGCYDGAKAYRTPFVSGKDSLNNQLKYTDPATGEPRLIEIPPTLLITGMGIVPDISKSVSMDAKRPGNILVLVGPTAAAMVGSHFQQLFGLDGLPREAAEIPATDLKLGPELARAVAELIRAGFVAAAHDVSDGGVLTAVAEMLIAAPGIGASLELSAVHAHPMIAAFGESPSRYVLEIAPADENRLAAALRGIPWGRIGTLDGGGTLKWPAAGLNEGTEDLARIWLTPLDW
jgi:phosphoribosylformylglycinamidine synthase II